MRPQLSNWHSDLSPCTWLLPGTKPRIPPRLPCSVCLCLCLSPAASANSRLHRYSATHSPHLGPVSPSPVGESTYPSLHHLSFGYHLFPRPPGSLYHRASPKIPPGPAASASFLRDANYPDLLDRELWGAWPSILGSAKPQMIPRGSGGEPLCLAHPPCSFQGVLSEIQTTSSHSAAQHQWLSSPAPSELISN